MKKLNSELYTTEWCAECADKEIINDDSTSRCSHLIEKDLAHQLSTRPNVEFDGLVVRRISGDAVCLEGVIRTKDDNLDISDFVKALYGVNVVVNRLVDRGCCASEETVEPDEDTVTDWR
ncbi:MAG: hypothetical protein JKY95_02835 [Planctomycetaceae bacterium]|nr:hypothetical protein [Planctomycetaceae bacterium]